MQIRGTILILHTKSTSRNRIHQGANRMPDPSPNKNAQLWYTFHRFQFQNSKKQEVFASLPFSFQMATKSRQKITYEHKEQKIIWRQTYLGVERLMNIANLRRGTRATTLCCFFLKYQKT